MIVSKTAPTHWVGIDVSKKSLDAAIWQSGKKYRHVKLANSASGIAALLDWAKKTAGDEAQIGFCMESTGDYHLDAAMYFTEVGHHVSVVNPARIKYFGLENGRLTKTDKADSKLIAEYARDRSPAAWPMRDETMRRLLRLSRRRQQLVMMIGIEDNRRECPQAIGQECLDSIKKLLKTLRAELRQVDAALALLIQNDPVLKEKSDLIRSLRPLGHASVLAILAEMPPVEEVASASSYAAAAGVQSTSKKSGENQRESARMSKAGQKIPRQILYMPTLTMIRSVPEVKALYDRLRERGRKHDQAMVACIRKVLMILYGVLRHKTPFKSRLAEESGSIAA